MDTSFLDISFNFVSSGTIIHDSAAQTGDFFMPIILTLFALAAIPVLIYTLRHYAKNGFVANFENVISKTQFKIFMAIMLSAVALISIFGITQAFAKNINQIQINNDSQKAEVYAYVDELTGEITFDQLTFTNTSDQYVTFDNISAQISDAAQSSAALKNATFVISGLNAQLYYGSFNEEKQNPSATIEALAVNNSTTISFSITGLDLASACSLIGTSPISSKIEIVDPIANDPKVIGTSFVYEGRIITAVEPGIGYVVNEGANRNVGTYQAVASVREGFTWADKSKADKKFDWKITQLEAVPEWVGPFEKTYDGTDIKINVLIKNMILGDDCYFNFVVTKDGLETSSTSDASTYIAKVTGMSGADSNNYSCAEGISKEYIVNRAQSHINNLPTETINLYTGQPFSITYDYVGDGKVVVTSEDNDKLTVVHNDENQTITLTAEAGGTGKVEIQTKQSKNYLNITTPIELTTNNIVTYHTIEFNVPNEFKSCGIIKDGVDNVWTDNLKYENIPYGTEVDYLIDYGQNIKNPEESVNLPLFNLIFKDESIQSHFIYAQGKTGTNYHFNLWTNNNINISDNGTYKVNGDLKFDAIFSNKDREEIYIYSGKEGKVEDDCFCYVDFDSDFLFLEDGTVTVSTSNKTFHYDQIITDGSSLTCWEYTEVYTKDITKYHYIKAGETVNMQDVPEKMKPDRRGGIFPTFLSIKNAGVYPTVYSNIINLNENSGGSISNSDPYISINLDTNSHEVRDVYFKIQDNNPNCVEIFNAFGYKHVYNAIPDANSYLNSWVASSPTLGTIKLEQNVNYSFTDDVTLTAVFEDKGSNSVFVGSSKSGNGFGEVNFSSSFGINALFVDEGSNWKVDEDKSIVISNNNQTLGKVTVENYEGSIFDKWTNGTYGTVNFDTIFNAEIILDESLDWKTINFEEICEGESQGKINKTKIQALDGWLINTEKLNSNVIYLQDYQGHKLLTVTAKPNRGCDFIGWYYEKDGLTKQLNASLVISENLKIDGKFTPQAKKVYKYINSDADIPTYSVEFYYDCSTHEQDLNFASSYKIFPYWDRSMFKAFSTDVERMNTSEIYINESFKNFHTYGLDNGYEVASTWIGHDFDNLNGFFSYFSDVTKIQGLENLFTDRIKIAKLVFEGFNAPNLDLTLENCSFENIKYVQYFFGNCNMRKIVVPQNFGLKADSFEGLFDSVSAAEIVLPQNFASNVKDTSYMFAYTEVGKVNFENLNCNKVSVADGMFCSTEIKNINLGTLNFSVCNGFNDMFSYADCENLVMPNITFNDNSYYTSFFNYATIKNLDLSRIDTTKDTSAEEKQSNMFNCAIVSKLSLGINWTFNLSSQSMGDYVWIDTSGNEYTTSKIPLGIAGTYNRKAKISLNTTTGGTISPWGDVSFDSGSGVNIVVSDKQLTIKIPNKEDVILNAVEYTDFKFDKWEFSEDISSPIHTDFEIKSIFIYSPAGVQAKAVVNNSTMTFIYDDAQYEGKVYYLNSLSWQWSTPFSEVKNIVKKISFDNSMKDYDGITDMSYWFDNFNNLESVEGLENLKLDNCTYFVNMFAYCSCLNLLDLSKVQYKAEDSYGGFVTECAKLESLTLPKDWPVTLTDMGLETYCTLDNDQTYMSTDDVDFPLETQLTIKLRNRAEIKSLPNEPNLSGWNDPIYWLPNKDLTYTTANNKLIFSIDGKVYSTRTAPEDNFLHWRFSSTITNDVITNGLTITAIYNLKSAKAVFSKSFKELRFVYDNYDYTGYVYREVPIDWNEDYSPFYNWKQESFRLKGDIKVIFDDNFSDYKGIKSTKHWFERFPSITFINLTNFDTSELENMEGMFVGSNINTEQLKDIDTSKVTNMSYLFKGYGLESINLDWIDTSSVKYMDGMFESTRLFNLDLSNFDVSNLKSINYLCESCNYLENINFGDGWTCNKLESAVGAFNSTSITRWDNNIVCSGAVDVSEMFSNSSVTFVDLSGISSVSSVKNLFESTDYVLEKCIIPNSSSDAYCFEDTGLRNDGIWYHGNEGPKSPSEYSNGGIYGIECEIKFEAYPAGSGELEGASPIKYNPCLDIKTNMSESSNILNLTIGSDQKVITAKTDGEYSFINWSCDDIKNMQSSGSITFYANYYAPIPKAVHVNDELHFVFDTNAYDDYMIVPNDYFDKHFAIMWEPISPFNKYSDVKKVVIEENFKKYKHLTSTSSWFANMTNLKEISGVGNIYSNNVIDSSCMFALDSSLLHLDMTGFNTDNLEYADWMFCYCTSLLTLDVSTMSINKIESCERLFSHCTSLYELDISNFKFPSNAEFYDVFGYCSNLTTIYASKETIKSFNNVPNDEDVFVGDYRLVGQKGSSYSTLLAAGYEESFIWGSRYAVIDQGPESDSPGYFTEKPSANVVIDIMNLFNNFVSFMLDIL